MSTTTEQDAKRYNGWTNYETWCVKLWQDNEEGSQRYWQEVAGWAKSKAGGDRDEALRLLSGNMKGQYGEAKQTLLESVRVEATCSVWADLLGGALSEVNWREIAEHLMEE